jgi:phenylacetate-CoA ligase
VLPRSELAEVQRRYPERAGFATIELPAFGRLGFHAGGEVDVAYAGRDGATIMAKLFAELGVTAEDVVVNTFGYHLATVAHVFDEGLRELGACVVPAGPGNSAVQLELVKRLRPTVWLGFPSFLWHVLSQAPDTSVSIRLAIVGGEFAPGVRRALHDRFDIDSRDFYGVSILGPAAFECTEKEGMHVVDSMLVEILDAQSREPVPPGDVGEMVLTPLAHDYLVPRVGTGDLSRWVDDPCRCGDPRPRIAGVLGRVGEGSKVRGVFVYPRDVRAVRRALPAEGDLSLVLSREENTTRDVLTLRVLVEEDEATPALDEAIRTAFLEECHVRLDDVQFVDEIDGGVLVDHRAWEVPTQ